MVDRVVINVYVDAGGVSRDVRDRLDAIDQKLATQVAQEAEQVADLSSIQMSVSRNADAAASAESLLTQLSQLIRDNVSDQAALNDLAAQLDAQAADLAASVLENTPQAPEPTPAPPEPTPTPTPAPEPAPEPAPPDTSTTPEPATGDGMPGM